MLFARVGDVRGEVVGGCGATAAGVGATCGTTGDAFCTGAGDGDRGACGAVVAVMIDAAVCCWGARGSDDARGDGDAVCTARMRSRAMSRVQLAYVRTIWFCHFRRGTGRRTWFACVRRQCR